MVAYLGNVLTLGHSLSEVPEFVAQHFGPCLDSVKRLGRIKREETVNPPAGFSRRRRSCGRRQGATL